MAGDGRWRIVEEVDDGEQTRYLTHTELVTEKAWHDEVCTCSQYPPGHAWHTLGCEWPTLRSVRWELN